MFKNDQRNVKISFTFPSGDHAHGDVEN